MWEVEFSNVPVECRIVHSDVDGLFNCFGLTIVLPSYYLEIVNRCCMATRTLVLVNG